MDADFKQPTLNRALTWQGGLGLPDRDYYLKADDERKANARAAYEVYLTTLAGAAGEKEPCSLKRVIDIDKHLCPNCGAGELKIIAAMMERPVFEKTRRSSPTWGWIHNPPGAERPWRGTTEAT